MMQALGENFDYEKRKEVIEKKTMANWINCTMSVTVWIIN